MTAEIVDRLFVLFSYVVAVVVAVVVVVVALVSAITVIVSVSLALLCTVKYRKLPNACGVWLIFPVSALFG